MASRENSAMAKLQVELPSREHISNIDDSLKLSSKTSMMHQFYIEQRKL